jgi:hypothetical protein
MVFEPFEDMTHVSVCHSCGEDTLDIFFPTSLITCVLELISFVLVLCLPGSLLILNSLPEKICQHFSPVILVVNSSWSST